MSKKLEEIEEIKMSRKEKRKKRDQDKKEKRKEQINWLYYVVIGGISLTVVVFFYSMYSMYQKTVDWKKAPETKIADIPAYMLYLALEEQEKVKQYNYIQSEIFDLSTGSFKNNANDDNIKKLTDLYEDLPKTLQARVKDNYTRVTELYKIKSNWEKLVKDKEIQEKVTPADISKFVEDNKDVIFKYLQERAPKKYITEVYNEILEVTKDVNVVNELLKTVNSNFNFNKGNIEVKEDVSSDFIANYDRLKRQLKNKWKIVSGYTDEIIFKAKSILEKHDKAIVDYKDFKKIVDERDVFDKWLKSYNETKDNLLNIPDLTGKSKEDIEKILKEVNLKVVYNEVEVEDEKEANKVIRQKPAKDSYDKIMAGSTIVVDYTVKKEKKVEKDEDKKDEDKDNVERRLQNRPEDNTRNNRTENRRNEGRR